MNEYWHQTFRKLEEERDQAILFAWSTEYKNQITPVIDSKYELGYEDGYEDGLQFRRQKQKWRTWI